MLLSLCSGLSDQERDEKSLFETMDRMDRSDDFITDEDWDERVWCNMRDYEERRIQEQADAALEGFTTGYSHRAWYGGRFRCPDGIDPSEWLDYLYSQSA